jgi:hypothetical protein
MDTLGFVKTKKQKQYEEKQKAQYLKQGHSSNSPEPHPSTFNRDKWGVGRRRWMVLSDFMTQKLAAEKELRDKRKERLEKRKLKEEREQKRAKTIEKDKKKMCALARKRTRTTSYDDASPKDWRCTFCQGSYYEWNDDKNRLFDCHFLEHKNGYVVSDDSLLERLSDLSIDLPDDRSNKNLRIQVLKETTGIYEWFQCEWCQEPVCPYCSAPPFKLSTNTSNREHFNAVHVSTCPERLIKPKPKKTTTKQKKKGKKSSSTT